MANNLLVVFLHNEREVAVLIVVVSSRDLILNVHALARNMVQENGHVQ